MGESRLFQKDHALGSYRNCVHSELPYLFSFSLLDIIDFNFDSGEVAREMFIIADGILEVISEQGRVLTTMKAGDFFGEIGILNLDGLNK